MSKERLVAFTDAVLAIIMTILVLELDKPDTYTFAGFWALRWNFFAYALSFFWLGSLWMGLNSIWEKAEKIDNRVVWWTLVLLFLASFIPYTTSLVGDAFDNHMLQAVYGCTVILMTVVNYHLHRVLDRPNAGNPALLASTAAYRRILIPDIAIKVIALVLSLLVYPPIMMFGVLAAAAWIFFTRKSGLPQA
ncbi:MAG: TMEM175 family protein [Lachnospiraceae bacterium]